MRGLPKLVDVERIAGGRQLIVESEGVTFVLKYGTGGCYVEGLTQVHIGRFTYDDEELEHELVVTLKNEREEYSGYRFHFKDPEFIKAQLEATRADIYHPKAEAAATPYAYLQAA